MNTYYCNITTINFVQIKFAGNLKITLVINNTNFINDLCEYTPFFNMGIWKSRNNTLEYKRLLNETNAFLKFLFTLVFGLFYIREKSIIDTF